MESKSKKYDKLSETEQIIRSYLEDKLSVHELARMYKTYPNKIRRLLLKNRVPIRGQSETQSILLEQGKVKHPTEGTKRPEKTKMKISESVAKTYQETPEEEIQRRKEILTEIWKNRPQSYKDEMLRRSAVAVAKAGREGSKIEKYLMENLPKRGIQVIFHKQGLIKDEQLQIDLFIPDIKLAIEIDGPSHFDPIWTEAKFLKKKEADNRKNGLLLANGYSVVRVKYLIKNLTQKKSRDILNQIVDFIEKVKKENKQNFYEEIEVN